MSSVSTTEQSKNVTTPIYIGVDGGGTKTLVTIVNHERLLLCCVRAGSTNPNSVGYDTAQQNLITGLKYALSLLHYNPTSSTSQNEADKKQTSTYGVEQVHVTLSAQEQSQVDHIISQFQQQSSTVEVKAVSLAMAGVDRESDSKLVKSWVQHLLPQAVIHVFSDAVAALASGTLGKLYGIVNISGTGMIAYGRNSEGEAARAGGWGVFTDGGSGYSIGIDVLKAVWAAHDHSGPETTMLTHLITSLQFKHIEELISWTYSDLSWSRIASLAPICFQQAQQGDSVALKILQEASQRLTNVIVTVARRLKVDQPSSSSSSSSSSSPLELPIVLSGSIHQQDLMKELMKKEISKYLPHAVILYPQVDAAMAAALLALTGEH